MATTNQEMATTNQDMATTHQEMATTNQEMATNHQAMVTTNQEMATTNQEMATTNQAMVTTHHCHRSRFNILPYLHHYSQNQSQTTYPGHLVSALSLLYASEWFDQLHLPLWSATSLKKWQHSILFYFLHLLFSL